MARGIPLVLVHGLLGAFEAPAILQQLDAFDVLTPALLGYDEFEDIDAQQIDLAAQASHVMQLAQARFGEQSFHLVGHSIGGVIATLMAHEHPRSVLSLINIEGNFTLRDAFWSARIAAMTPQQAQDLLHGMRANPLQWLRDCGIGNAGTGQLAYARHWLVRQSAATLQAMSRSVLAVTGASTYAQLAQTVFARMPVALLAGSCSRKDWDLPPWADQMAEELTLMDHAGHMMMLNDAGKFGAVLNDMLGRQVLRSAGA